MTNWQSLVSRRFLKISSMTKKVPVFEFGSRTEQNLLNSKDDISCFALKVNPDILEEHDLKVYDQEGIE